MSDMRIPVFLLRGPKTCPAPRAESYLGDKITAYLLEGDNAAPEGSYAVRFALPVTRHFIGCACCTPRGPAAAALSVMFRARSTGAAPFFHQVVAHASPAGIAAVRSALADDAVAAARFRYDPC